MKEKLKISKMGTMTGTRVETTKWLLLYTVDFSKQNSLGEGRSGLWCHLDVTYVPLWRVVSYFHWHPLQHFDQAVPRQHLRYRPGERGGERERMRMRYRQGERVREILREREEVRETWINERERVSHKVPY